MSSQAADLLQTAREGSPLRRALNDFESGFTSDGRLRILALVSACSPQSAARRRLSIKLLIEVAHLHQGPVPLSAAELGGGLVTLRLR